MTNEPKPLTRESFAYLREYVLACGPASEWNRENVLAALDAGAARIAALEVEVARLGEQLDEFVEQRIPALDAEVARLKAVACEWEPFDCEVSVVMDADNPGPFVCIAPDTDYPDRLSLEVNGLDRENAGCLAATLAHFARTGALPT